MTGARRATRVSTWFIGIIPSSEPGAETGAIPLTMAAAVTRSPRKRAHTDTRGPTTGNPEHRKPIDTEVVGERSDITGPVPQSPMRMEGAVSIAGTVGDDEPDTDGQQHGGVDDELMSGARGSVKREHR